MTQLSRRSVTKWTTAALAAVAMLAVPQTVRADHDSFVYDGPTYGFHGEAHVIRALAHLERAYNAGYDAHRPLRRAVRQARLAFGQVCHPRARYLVRGAIDHMNDFQYRGNLAHLDDAARLLNRALVVEQRKHAFVRDTVFPGPVARRNYLPYRTSRTYWGPRSPWRGRYFGPRSGLYFGGRRGGISISF